VGGQRRGPEITQKSWADAPEPPHSPGDPFEPAPI